MYRFYNNTEYRIAEAGNIYIYTQDRNIAQSKGYKVVNAYFFSTTPDGELLPLTLGQFEKRIQRGNDKFPGPSSTSILMPETCLLTTLSIAPSK